MLKEFRDFVLRGNVVELAVAVVIGAAFGALVTAFVASFVTPLIAAIGGEPDFSDLAFTINDSRFTYGAFFNALLVVPDHRRGGVLLRRAPAQHADGAAAAGAGRRPRRAAVPGVPVGHPDRGAALRVLHRGGRVCLISLSAPASRRRRRSRRRGSSASRSAAPSRRRATSC